MVRFFTLTAADVGIVDPGRGRSGRDRLGLAVQLGRARLSYRRAAELFEEATANAVPTSFAPGSWRGSKHRVWPRQQGCLSQLMRLDALGVWVSPSS